MLVLEVTGAFHVALVAVSPKFIVWPAVSPLMLGVVLTVPVTPAPRFTPFHGVPTAVVTVVPLGRAGTLKELSWPALPAVRPRLKVVAAPPLRFVVEKFTEFNTVSCTARDAAGPDSVISGAISGTSAFVSAPKLITKVMAQPMKRWV